MAAGPGRRQFLHRGNADRTARMLALGEALGATRIEIAHTQYYGWALLNRSGLMPTLAQLESATDAVQAARRRFGSAIAVDYVVLDYFATRPKACMNGWGQRFINVSPSGKALPCHAADALPGFVFPSVRNTPLADIWSTSDAFLRFRGVAGAPAACRSCDRLEIHWGGCRCQAFALLGDAAVMDPACALSPDHAMMAAAVTCAADADLTPRRAPVGLAARRAF